MSGYNTTRAQTLSVTSADRLSATEAAAERDDWSKMARAGRPASGVHTPSISGSAQRLGRVSKASGSFSCTPRTALLSVVRRSPSSWTSDIELSSW